MKGDVMPRDVHPLGAERLAVDAIMQVGSLALNALMAGDAIVQLTPVNAPQVHGVHPRASSTPA